MPSKNETEKKFKYVDYINWNFYDIGYKWFDWRFYGRLHKLDINDPLAVNEYLYKRGFIEKKLSDMNKEFRQRMITEQNEADLRRYER